MQQDTSTATLVDISIDHENIWTYFPTCMVAQHVLNTNTTPGRTKPDPGGLPADEVAVLMRRTWMMAAHEADALASAAALTGFQFLLRICDNSPLGKPVLLTLWQTPPVISLLEMSYHWGNPIVADERMKLISSSETPQ